PFVVPGSADPETPRRSHGNPAFQEAPDPRPGLHGAVHGGPRHRDRERGPARDPAGAPHGPEHAAVGGDRVRPAPGWLPAPGRPAGRPARPTPDPRSSEH